MKLFTNFLPFPRDRYPGASLTHPPTPRHPNDSSEGWPILFLPSPLDRHPSCYLTNPQQIHVSRCKLTLDVSVTWRGKIKRILINNLFRNVIVKSCHTYLLFPLYFGCQIFLYYYFMCCILCNEEGRWPSPREGQGRWTEMVCLIHPSTSRLSGTCGRFLAARFLSQ